MFSTDLSVIALKYFLVITFQPILDRIRPQITKLARHRGSTEIHYIRPQKPLYINFGQNRIKNHKTCLSSRNIIFQPEIDYLRPQKPLDINFGCSDFLKKKLPSERYPTYSCTELRQRLFKKYGIDALYIFEKFRSTTFICNNKTCIDAAVKA